MVGALGLTVVVLSFKAGQFVRHHKQDLRRLNFGFSFTFLDLEVLSVDLSRFLQLDLVDAVNLLDFD